jgi:hypothetical protein
MRNREREKPVLPLVDVEEDPRDTVVLTIACAALASDKTGEAMQKHLCYWLDKTLRDDKGKPIKHHQCPIHDYATNECRVTTSVAYHSYELVQREYVGKMLQDGIEVDVEAIHHDDDGAKIVKVLELRDDPPDLDGVFTTPKSQKIHKLGLRD